MIIQLTNLGLEELEQTLQPLKITRYELGNGVGYTPALDASGLKGELVYESNPTDPIAVSANVVKYRIGLDYGVGDFSFGELALFTEKGCVAVATADQLIQKVKYIGADHGNSIVIEVYLEMTDGNYSLWVDDLIGDNKFVVPVVNSIDALPPVSDATPNLYIVSGESNAQSSVIAYASKNGLWDFDAYQYKNSHEFKIVSATSTTCEIDITGMTDEQLQELRPQYFGQMFVEFLNMPVVSICRIIGSFSVVGNQGILSFRTPMAKLPAEGTSLRVFSRQALSVSDLIIPVASETQLGGIIVGDGLSITPEGVLSPDFPVTSVNGQMGDVELAITDIKDTAQVAVTGDYWDLENIPAAYTLPVATDSVLGGVMIPSDGHLNVSESGYLTLNYEPVKTVNGFQPDPVTGNVEVKFEMDVVGLIQPMRIPTGTDLNDFNTSGIFYGKLEDIGEYLNLPDYELTSDFTLEVVPIGDGVSPDCCVQRLTTDGNCWIRMNFSYGWGEWQALYTAHNMPIATATTVGVVKPGPGLFVDDDGTLSASVTSVFGKTGDVTMTVEEWEAVFQVFYNTPSGIPQLTDFTEDPDLSDEENRAIQYTRGRVGVLQLTYGAMYFAGYWNASTNVLNDDPEQKLENGGYFTWLREDDYEPLEDETPDADETFYDRWIPKGYVFIISENGTTEIDGQSHWSTGDIVLCTGEKWQRILSLPNRSGIMTYDFDTETVHAQPLVSSDNSLRITQTIGENQSIDLQVNKVWGGTF